MEPPKPIEFYIDPTHWGFPVAVALRSRGVAVAVLCFHIEINWSAS